MKRAAVIIGICMVLAGCSGGGDGGLGVLQSEQPPTVTLRPDGIQRAEHLTRRKLHESDIKPLAEQVCGRIAKADEGDGGPVAWIAGAMGFDAGDNETQLQALARVIDSYCPQLHAKARADFAAYGVDVPDTDLTPHP